MDPTEELDLGADDYTEEEKAKGNDLFGGISANKKFHPLVHNPVQDLYEYPLFVDQDGDGEQDELDPAASYNPAQFEDYKKLNGELSALSSDAAGLGRLRKTRKDALDGFMESHMAPFYKETLGEGLLDAQDKDFEDSDKLFKRFDDHFQNSETQDKLPKYKQIKEKYGRLKADFDRYNNAEQNALSRKDALTTAKYSFPETFRRAADNYKTETQKPLSDKALNELLDSMEFEEPVFGLNGLLNEHKLDPRVPLDMGTGLEGELGQDVKKRQQSKLNVLKKFKQLESLQQRDEGLRSQGVDFSENGKFGGFPLYLNPGERSILSLEKAQQAGATTWKGQPIEQAFEDLGGQDKLIASKMVETVFNAHNIHQDAAVNYWRDQTPDNKEKFDLSKRVLEESWAQAARLGLGNDIPGRGDTVGFFSALGNAFRRGDLQEDLSDFTPALLGAIDVDTAQQIIDIMEQTEELGMSSAYKSIKATESDDLLEAFGKIFSNASAIPEMVAETLTAFFSAWITEGARVVPAFAGIGAAKGALYGSGAGPKGTAAGAVGGAIAGGGWGLKASAGVASFVLEYAGEVLNEMGQMGIDWKNPHIFVAAWNNPKIREKIRAKAAKYAGGIAMIDLVAAGTVGKVKTAVATKTPSNLIRSRSGALGSGNITRKSNIAGNIAETGYQAGLGMTGEAVGQVWSRDPGDPLIRDWDALAAEGLIEFAGPSGAGIVANMVTDKIGSHQMSVEGAQEKIISRVDGSYNQTTVEEVDKDGFRFTRRFFPNADIGRQELSKLGVNFDSAEGKVLYMLMKLMGGNLRRIGFAFADRSPTAQNMKGAYDPSTGTIYINNLLSKSHALTILHESGHFVEQFFGIDVRELYNKLSPEEKEDHWATYVKAGEAKFSDLNFWQKAQYNGVPIWRAFGEKNSSRAASEWFSHQMVRVLTGADQNIDSKVKKTVEDFIKLFENSEEAEAFIGSGTGQSVRETLANVLMEAFGVDMTGGPATIEAFGDLILDNNPQNSSMFPQINFGQDISTWTDRQKDILAFFLGFNGGWGSIDPASQKSIANYFAGANMLNDNIQEQNMQLGERRSDGGLVPSRSPTGRKLKTKARQKIKDDTPGVIPSLRSRQGRTRRQGFLGSENLDRVTGSDKGRDEEIYDPFDNYSQTRASLNLDRESVEEELDYLEQQADETAQEEAGRLEKKEVKVYHLTSDNIENLLPSESPLSETKQYGQGLYALRGKPNPKDYRRAVELNIQTEGFIQIDADAPVRDTLKYLEDEGVKISPQATDKEVGFSDEELSSSFNDLNPNSGYNVFGMYQEESSIRKELDLGYGYVDDFDFRKENPQVKGLLIKNDENFGDFYVVYSDDAIVQREADILGSQKEKSNLVRHFTDLLFNARASDKGKPFSASDPDRNLNQREVYSTHFWKWNDSLVRKGVEDKDRRVWFDNYHPDKFYEYYPAKLKPAPIGDAFVEYLKLRGKERAPDTQAEFTFLGSNKIDSFSSKINKLLTEAIAKPSAANKSTLKTKIDDIIEKNPKLKKNPTAVLRNLLGIKGMGLTNPNKPFFVEAQRDIPAWYITEGPWAGTKGPLQSGSLHLNDVDHAVSDYLDIEPLRQLARQAPIIEKVLEPFGVHLIDPEISGITPVFDDDDQETRYSEVIVGRKIGGIGQLVNFRNQRTFEGKVVKKDLKNGEAISRPEDVYAYRIVDWEYNNDFDDTMYTYTVEPVTKEEATVSMPWYEVPLSRLALTSAGETAFQKYTLTPEQREVWGDAIVYGKGEGGRITILRQYTTIADALRQKEWRQVGKRLQLPKSNIGSVGDPEPESVQANPIQELVKLAGGEIAVDGKITRFGQGPLFRIYDKGVPENLKDQVDLPQSRMILNLVFASLNHQQQITNSDLKRAAVEFRAELENKDRKYNPINWENLSILRPDYSPMTPLASLFARVLDIMGDRKKDVPVTAETLADYQLLELMGVREWVENLPMLQFYLPAESRSVGTGAIFTALRRFIVTANQDFIGIGEEDGNILSALIKNTPDETLYPEAADGAARLETIKMLATQRTPQGVDSKTPKYSDAFSFKNANEELDYAYGWYMDENGQMYWDMVEYNAPRYETTKDGITIDNALSGRGTGIYEGESYVGNEDFAAAEDRNPKDKRKRSQRNLRALPRIFSSRRSKKSILKSERQQNEYLADQIKLQAAAQRVNPDKIGTLNPEDLFGEKEFPPTFRREAEHPSALRSKDPKDYESGKPAVTLKTFVDTQNSAGKVTISGAQKARKAAREGKGVHVMREQSGMHYGNPFSKYDERYKKGNTVRVFSRKAAIAAYRQWLRAPFSESTTVVDQDIYQSQDDVKRGSIWDESEIDVASVEPERRKWIIDQIKSGKLDGKTLLYGTQYDGMRGENHATVLADFINELRPKQKAEQWKIDWATGKDREKGYYNWVLRARDVNMHAMIMGKKTSVPLTKAQKEQIINTRSLLGEAGKDEIHGRPVLNSEEETPLSVANKVEMGLVSASTPASKNKMDRETEGGIANGLVHALKWADYILLSYFDADPSAKNPQAVLDRLTDQIASVYYYNQRIIRFINQRRAGTSKPLIKSEYSSLEYGKDSFVNDQKLLIIRKIVADSHGLTERFGERIETPVSEDTSAGSPVDPFSPEGEDTADIEAGNRDKSKAVRLEQRGDSGQVDSSAIAPDEALMEKEDASQELFKSIAFNDNDLAALNSLRKDLVEEQGEPGTTEQAVSKELAPFIQKQLLKSVRDGTDNTVVQDLARALVRAKKINTIEQAQKEIYNQLDKLQKNKFKVQNLDRPPKKDFDRKGSKDAKYVKPGKSYSREAPPVQSNINLPEETGQPTGLPKKGTQPQFSAETGLASAKQKKQYIVPVPPIKIASKINDALNQGMLGSTFLTSSFATPLFEQLKWMAMGSYDKLPESVQKIVYETRVGIFSQFISAEDLHQRLVMQLGLGTGKHTKDFFDLQGHIIRNFSTVKAASDYWRTDLRDPIVDYLIEYKVTPEEFGALAIAIGMGNQNRYIEKKLKAAVETQMERLYGEKKWDSKTQSEVRAGGGIIDNIDSAKKALDKAQQQGHQKGIDRAQGNLDRLKAEKRSAERKIKEIDIDSYRVGSEFAGGGMTSAEAIATYDKLKNEPRIKKLLKETDIMKKFNRLNLQTIVMLGTSGIIDAGQVYRMYVSHYRVPIDSSPQAAHKKVIRDLEGMGLDFKNTDITTDYSKLDPKVKQDWQNQFNASRSEIKQGMPSGYFYASMVGFADVEGFWQTQEELNDVFGESPKSGGRGAGKGIEPSRTNRLFEFSRGRKVGVAPPDPNVVLAMSFASAENAVVRVAKKPSSDHVISLYRFYLDLHKHKGDFSKLSNTYSKDGVMPNSKPLIDRWELGAILKDKNTTELLFKELDEIFDPLDFDKEKMHPVVESVRPKEIKGADGSTRLVIQHVTERISDDDKTLFIGRSEGKRDYAKFKANISGKRFIAELKNMNHKPLHPLLHNNYYSINAMTKFLSMTYTSWNPDFIFTNAIRDAVNAQLNMSEQQSEKFKKSFRQNYVKKIARANKGIFRSEKKMNAVQKRELMIRLNIPLDLKGMIKKYGFDDLSAESWQAWWLFLEINGLRTSFIRLDSMQDVNRKIEKEFKDGTQGNMWEKLNKKSPIEVIKKIGEDYVDPLNTTVENATRLVTAVEALKAGMTVHQAVMLGRNVSVDFNRKGQMSSNIGALFVFFNAGIQGNLRFFRSLIMRGPKDAMKLVGSIMGTSFLWAWLQMLISGDEEEDDNFSHYDELGDSQKDMNMVGFIPGTKTHFSIPLPYGWNFIWGAGQKLAQVSARQVEVGGQGLGAFEAMSEMTSNFHRQFNPIGGTTTFGPIPMPTIATPFVELGKNENFFGGPIEKVAFPFDPPTPQAYMNRESTAKFWKDLAITLNSLGGGDQVTPGSLKRMFGDNSLYSSPENDVEWALSGSAMEHMYNAFTGGIGATATRIISGGYSTAQGDFGVNLSQVPVVRRFVRNDYSSYKTLQRFFRLRDRANMADRYVKLAKKGGMPLKQAKEALRLNRNLINIKGLVDAADTSRKALKRKGDAVMKSDLSASEKRKKMEEIEKQTLAAYRKVLIKASKLGIEV